jgi:hypothetical protein
MAFVDDAKAAYDQVLVAIDGLTAEEMTRENTIGKWSARDNIIHMALWDGEALKGFAVWRTGHEYDWTYANEYLKLNDTWHEITKKLDLNQVIQVFNLTRNALLADIASIPDEIWQKRGGVPKWLNGLLIEHSNWHLAKLQAYRTSLGK